MRNNTHEKRDGVTFPSIPALRQAIVPGNIFNNFKCAGYSQKRNKDGTCHAEVAYEQLTAVQQEIDANGSILKY
ncbi:MAG: hypothetical protein EZS28_007659 [Streblomastix strix]|uniref:Uncharacterized protein n=1 Tax=Streblomastix strix TaxID=222440 RepID=A0A5J4WNZ4_9EUKA|nr:MAG: hypothetical protein EZS28_007659 [Streblomastix strix]